MPYDYQAKYSTDGVTFTALTNVQNIAVKLGREKQLDAYNASSCTIEIRYPTGFASPIADLKTGTYMKVESPNQIGGVGGCFFGRIRDVQVRYGIPYAGSVGNADYLTISCEGFFAAVARMNGNNYSMLSDTPQNQLSASNTFTSTTGAYLRPTGSNPVMAATTVSGTWGDWYNQLLTTLNGRMWDSNIVDEIKVVSPFYQNPQNPAYVVTFSDNANPVTQYIYDQIDFTSYADNFWTQAAITPKGLSTVTVTASGATAPYRTYSLNSLNSSTGQATDFGNYLVSLYGTSQFRISSISCLMEASSKNAQLDLLASQSPASYMGMRIVVVFRGTTFDCIIEGVTITATPESSRYTFTLSSAEQNNYLILDSTVFGTLDFNKLGY
jgi:hypothetical protein